MRCSCGARESWWCRVAESLALYVRLVSARVRAQWQYRASFALDVRRRVPRLVPRLHRHPRHLRQRAAARRLERAGGRAPLRHRRCLVLDRRAGRRPPRSAAAADPRRELRPRARQAPQLAAPGDRLRLPSASVRKAPPVDRRARVRRRGARHRLDGGSRRHDRRSRARRSRDLRRHLGGGHHHRLLGRRGTRVGELVHRRGQLPLGVSDRRLRRLAAAVRDLRRADGVRGVLPGAATSSTSPIRSARPTGCRSPRRRSRWSQPSAPATYGASPCATTGARAAR